LDVGVSRDSVQLTIKKYSRKIKMKKVLTIAALAAILPQAASALPLVDFYAGAYYWDQAVSGDVSGVDVKDDLNLSAVGQTVTYFAFEHPIPLIPNIKLKNTKMSSDGTGVLTTSLNLGGEVISGSTSVASKLDLTHTDYTLYWGLPLPIVTVDFGLTLRQFDGSMSAVSTTNSTVDASADLDVVVPMGYLKAGAYIPMTGISLGGDVNVISFGDTGITDYDLNVTYTMSLIPLLDIGVMAGYRSFDLELDPSDFGGSSSDLSAKAVVDGPYLGLSLHL
jgi:outer membrane protein